MKKDLERLETFLKQLPAEVPVAFEFRHPTWFDDDVLDLLCSQNRPLCVSDTDDTDEHVIGPRDGIRVLVASVFRAGGCRLDRIQAGGGG